MRLCFHICKKLVFSCHDSFGISIIMTKGCLGFSIMLDTNQYAQNLAKNRNLRFRKKSILLSCQSTTKMFIRLHRRADL